MTAPFIFAESILMDTVRKVIVTGGVAIGKTTIITRLVQLLGDDNVIVVREYIDSLRDGVEMLNRYLTNEIDCYTFQKYILNYYETTLERISYLDLTNKIVIFERTVDDSITCFSNRDHNIGKLSTEQFFELFQIAKRIDERYSLPSWLVSTTIDNAERNDKNENVFIPIRSNDVEKDSNIIYSIIENRIGTNHYSNIIIGLYNDAAECYKRIQKRNRKGEEAYTKEWIADFNYNYMRLFQKLMDGESVDITGMDSLLRH